MNESTLQIVQSLKIVYLAGFSYLYGRGGMNNKWIRRIIGSVFLTLGVVLFSLWQEAFSYWYLAYALLLWAALSIGYGAENLKDKIVRRFLFGLAFGFASIPVAWVNGAWIMFGLHINFCILISVLMGIIDDMPEEFQKTKVSARASESIIATVGGLLPLFYF